MAKGAKNEGSEAPAAPKRNLKKIIIIAVAGLLVLAIAAGAAFFFLRGGDEHESDDAEHAKKAPPKPPVFVNLEPFTVNLRQGGGGEFLQAAMTFKVSEEPVQALIKLHMPEIRSRILLLLSGKGAEELMSSEGKTALAEQIRGEVNALLDAAQGKAPKKPAASGKIGGTAEGDDAPRKKTEPAESDNVLGVFFTSFIVQ